MSAEPAAAARRVCPQCLAVFRASFACCPKHGRALQELAGDPLIGSTFADRYLIEELIGEGGMGRVYRARHHRVSRRFAIKVLFGDFVADPKMEERFAREAEAASRLEHPNLVSVVDFGESDAGLLYLVMDYASGIGLSTLIDEQAPLIATRAARLTAQLCAGLAHAHGKGLVHRDFKSDNVIVGTDERGDEVARIVDFGIAILNEPGDEPSRLTTEGLVLGTPAYMAPEQATGEGLDHRADLFALGLMLYEMLSGVLPFTGSPIAIARMNVAVNPPPIAERVPGLIVHPGLESVAMKLMAKSPSDRYQSADEALTAILAVMPSALPRASSVAVADAQSTWDSVDPTVVLGATTRRQEGPARRGRRALWIGATLALGAGGVAAVLGSSSGGSESPGAVAVTAGATAAPADRSTDQAVALSPARAGQTAPEVHSAAAMLEGGSADDAARAADASSEAQAGQVAAVAATGGAVEAERAAGAPGSVATRPPQQRRAATRKPAAGSAGGRARSGAGAQVGGTTPPPPSAADAAIPAAALTRKYTAVGALLERFVASRGDVAAASLRRRYFALPYTDALRTPTVRSDVMQALAALEKELRANLD